jgi:hypothetical protein
VAEVCRDAAWNPQNANPDCSANADRHAKGHSEDAKKPFFAERGRINKSSVRLHAFGLADSTPHNKSAALGHLNLDFALPSVQLAADYWPNVNLSNFLAELKRRNVYNLNVSLDREF